MLFRLDCQPVLLIMMMLVMIIVHFSVKIVKLNGQNPKL